MDIDLKPSNGTGENRKEGKDRHLLPGDNRSAVCKWISGKGEKEKERTLRSHFESGPRLCGSWQRKGDSERMSKNPCKRQPLSMRGKSSSSKRREKLGRLLSSYKDVTQHLP